MEELQDGTARETFLVPGEAPNVLVADSEAWHALESCLGRDPVAAWTLANMSHVYKQPGLLEFTATFERDPEYPVPPMIGRDVSDEEVEEALGRPLTKTEKAAKGKGPRS